MLVTRNEYENVDEKSQTPTESIYKNPPYEKRDKDDDNELLLTNTISSKSTEGSSYEEVEAHISNTDDPTMLCVTFRSIFIGILLTCLMSFTVQFFAFRTLPLDVNVGIVILISYLIGKIMATILPSTIFNIKINPGSFTYKEHALITIMATSCTRTSEAIETITIQRFYYKYYLNHFSAILFILIMQFIAITVSDSPILVPFWAHVNIFVGFVATIWIVTPIIYYLNVWNLQEMPIVSNRVFDADGYYYNVRKIMNDHFRVNQTARQIYGKSIVEQYRSSLADAKNDIHAKLMSYYPAVPEWWYYTTLIATLLIATIFCASTKLMPPGMMLLTIIFLCINTLPNGIITATTSMSIQTFILSDFVSGLILPGRPLGFLAFRIFSTASQNQIMIYLTNYKIGHYMKISPRVTLALMITSAIIASIVHYSTALYLLNNVANICTNDNPSWKCLNVENTYTASIVFSLSRVFAPGSRYSIVLLAIPLGFFLPILSWYLWKKYPSIKRFALINFPILLMGPLNIPPASAAEFPTWFFIGFIFNYVLYRYVHDWWKKYAFIFSAAMSCGVVICGYFIFFVLESNGVYFPAWWGTGGVTRDGCPLASANYSGVIPIDRKF
ncbi:hypothetical protein I4U23_007273 [Adineta vaga]|nr:hypothetical protein I4U23_007273 [Adineta vaga]